MVTETRPKDRREGRQKDIQVKRTPLRPGTKRLERRAGLPRSKKPMRARKGHRFPKNVNEAFREWIRQQPCAVAKAKLVGRYAAACHGPIQCAHVRSRGAGGRDVGNCLPLCMHHHSIQHEWGIRTFQETYGVDLRELADRAGRQWVADHPESLP